LIEVTSISGESPNCQKNARKMPNHRATDVVQLTHHNHATSLTFNQEAAGPSARAIASS
jgi:hypothetical protein